MLNGIRWDELTPEERLIAEQAVENFRELNQACNEASDGTVLAIAESLAMRQGRELIRKTLQASLSGQAEGVEKKGRRAGVAPVADAVPTADAKPGRS